MAVDDLDCVAGERGREERPEVEGSVSQLAPCEQDPGKVFVHRQLHQQEGFVVLQVHVELGLVFADQVALQDESFHFGVGDDEFEIADLPLQDLRLLVPGAAGLEVGTHPVPEALALADVEDALLGIPEQVDAALVGKVPEPGLQNLLVHRAEL